jgi:hypothetical protein
MTDRKKPGVAFLANVALVAVLVAVIRTDHWAQSVETGRTKRTLILTDLH